MNRHSDTIHAKCPINSEWDYYEVTVSTPAFLEVGDFQSVLNKVRGSEETQEIITATIASGLPEHCSVRVVGLHGRTRSETTA